MKLHFLLGTAVRSAFAPQYLPFLHSGRAVHHAAVCLCMAASLQTANGHAQTASLKEVTVTGTPLGAADLIAPAASYCGAGLLLRSKTTLGETLDGTPGVSSTYFGPNASRPIIRGLDGDRIRILNNSGTLMDASGLSFDHSVSSAPISVERIEVLRGPGALQYGGSAVGGCGQCDRQPHSTGSRSLTRKAASAASWIGVRPLATTSAVAACWSKPELTATPCTSTRLTGPPAT